MGSSGQHINKELFAKLATGDELAFRQVFHYYTPRLQPFVFSIVKSASIAEEIVQDVFMKLWVNRVQVAGKDNPSSWLFTVAANQSFSFLKRMATERRFIDGVKKNMQEVPGQRTTENLLFSREAEGLLKEAMETLPPQRQLIFRLSRLEELTHKQIAEKLNISPHTVKNQLVSAIRSVQEYLRKAGTLFFLLLISLFR